MKAFFVGNKLVKLRRLVEWEPNNCILSRQDERCSAVSIRMLGGCVDIEGWAFPENISPVEFKEGVLSQFDKHWAYFDCEDRKVAETLCSWCNSHPPYNLYVNAMMEKIVDDDDAWRQEQRGFAKTLLKKWASRWCNISGGGDRLPKEEQIRNASKWYKRRKHWGRKSCDFAAKKDYEDCHQSIDSLAPRVSFKVLKMSPRIARKLLWVCPLDDMRVFILTRFGFPVQWYHRLWCDIRSKMEEREDA